MAVQMFLHLRHNKGKRRGVKHLPGRKTGTRWQCLSPPSPLHMWGMLAKFLGTKQQIKKKKKTVWKLITSTNSINVPNHTWARNRKVSLSHPSKPVIDGNLSLEEIGRALFGESSSCQHFSAWKWVTVKLRLSKAGVKMEAGPSGE